MENRLHLRNFQPFLFLTIVFLVISIIPLKNVQSAHIVFFHSLSSYSHRVQTYPLASALAEQGHNVTFISPFHIRKHQSVNPNISEIVPAAMSKRLQKMLSQSFNIKRRVEKTIPKLSSLFEGSVQLCEDFLASPELKLFLSTVTSVDLVVITNAASECGLGIAHKYGAKHIVFQVLAMLGHEYDTYGFVAESASVPETDPFSPATPMTFFQKVYNTLSPIVTRYEQYKFITKVDKLVREHMHLIEMPFLDDIVRNASLIFHPGDPITDYGRALPPNFVKIGGLHSSNNMKSQDLPSELQTILNNSKEVVYISLGSIVEPSAFPDDIRQAFFETIQSFPSVKFLWKWSGTRPKELPPNLHLDHWFPQKEILAHPKVKAFITQGGRPSVYESLCNAVPTIVFPVLSDQDNNANKMNLMGANVVLELGTVTREQLTDAVNKVVYDTSMKARMLELQRIFDDQPTKPLETALWWTEYVLRHDELVHLRPAGIHQSWFQRRLLDVWALIFTVALITTIIIGSLVACICKSFLCRSVGTKSKVQ